MLRHLIAVVFAIFIFMNVFHIEIPGAGFADSWIIWLAVLPFAYVVLAGLLRTDG